MLEWTWVSEHEGRQGEGVMHLPLHLSSIVEHTWPPLGSSHPQKYTILSDTATAITAPYVE